MELQKKKKKEKDTWQGESGEDILSILCQISNQREKKEEKKEEITPSKNRANGNTGQFRLC